MCFALEVRKRDWEIRGLLYSKFSFWEVYRWMCGRKFSFTATLSEAIKHDFWPYIWQYTSTNESFEYGYPHFIALLQFRRKMERFKLHIATRCLMKCDIINDVKLFPTVYCRIYCHKFLTLSNQK